MKRMALWQSTTLYVVPNGCIHSWWRRQRRSVRRLVLHDCGGRFCAWVDRV